MFVSLNNQAQFCMPPLSICMPSLKKYTFNLVGRKAHTKKSLDYLDIVLFFLILKKKKVKTSWDWVVPSWVELSLVDVKSSLKLSWNSLLSKKFCVKKSLVKTFLSPKNFGFEKLRPPKNRVKIGSGTIELFMIWKKTCQDKYCLFKCHPDIRNLLKMVPGAYL